MGWIEAIEASEEYGLPPGATFKIISGYRKRNLPEELLNESDEYSREDVFKHNLLIMLDEKHYDGLDFSPQHDKRCPIHKED